MTRKTLLVAGMVCLLLAAGVYWWRGNQAPAQAAGAPGGGRPGMAAGGMGGGRGGAFGRSPMTVELAPAEKTSLREHLVVVGNFVGAATVEVVPKVNGRLETVGVRIGDRVARGQQLAKVEDREIREQVNQAEASFEVAAASVRQREADLKFAETNLDRSRSLFERQLLPRQTLDDAEARQQAAIAQLDLARAQFNQAKARLEELRINLSNTVIVSPVDGFVGKRYLDPGAFVSSNAPVVSVVDLSVVRVVANLVEKDVRRVSVGTTASARVDAYPTETFMGRVARVAPVLDPATRTAEMEIEVPNPGFRLLPGMYARIELVIDEREDALVVPRNAVVDLNGERGVFLAEDRTARFRPVRTGLQDGDKIEIVSGLEAGTPVITTGAAGLQDGDTVILAGDGPSAGPGGPPGDGMRGGRSRPEGAGPASGGGRRRPGAGPPGAAPGAADGSAPQSDRGGRTAPNP